jgi:hypothetical protein
MKDFRSVSKSAAGVESVDGLQELATKGPFSLLNEVESGVDTDGEEGDVLEKYAKSMGIFAVEVSIRSLL